jgi:ubiquinone/menaquinone biosynthesis C-methylase UbiE
MAIELARAGRCVTGIDVSRVALEKARSRGERVRGLEFTLVTGVNLPYADAVFNFAYSIEVLAHLHERDVKPISRKYEGFCARVVGTGS